MAHRGPSPHLSWDEIACKDGTPYPIVWRKERAVHLGRLFELIRREAGNKPITVLSGFRTFDWNKKIRGAINSQHMFGRALDLRPPEGHSVTSFHRLIYNLPASSGLRGLGLYKTFVHVDIRESNFLAQWSGSGAKDDSPAD